MKHTLTFFIIFSSVIASAQPYQLEDAFPSLPAFTRGLDLQYVPDGSNRFVVVQQLGLAYIFQNTSAVSSRKVFLDLSNRVSQAGGELGFLGLAFHPNFSENGYIYVNFTTGAGTPSDSAKSYISRFQATGVTKDTILRSTEKVLLTFTQPYSNHNGGWIAFGPDGYLYTSFGDGGSGGDPQNRAQNKNQLFGKILRIDVNTGDPYSIPSTNPFASGGGRPEVFAYGLRNPWKCSFDPATKKLWAGDVGQGAWEEIDTIINGGNYGWRVKEGYSCFGSPSCDSTGFQSPLWVYSHAIGNSITGGYVYGGAGVPSLSGKYIYADYGSGKVWALTYEQQNVATNELLVDMPTAISSFGIDQNRELYIVSYNMTRIYKFVQELGVSKAIDQVPKIDVNYSDRTFTISNFSIQDYSIQIFDMLGRKVQEFKPSYITNTCDLSSLMHGGYFITIKNSKTGFIKKIFL
jgi:glucose/arabinose dehydrogenase